VLRLILRLKRGEVSEDWRRLHDEELHNSYNSSHIIRVILSRKMKCEMRTIFWLEYMKGRDHSVDLGVDRRIILEWISGKHGGEHEDMDRWWAVVNTVMKLQVP